MPERVLITGADGFIGRALAAHLAGSGTLPDGRIVEHLILTDRQTGAAPHGARVLPGDLTDPALHRALADTQPTLVFHLAGLLGGGSERDPAQSWRINFEAPVRLFAALGPAVVVDASSIAVYGTPMPARIDDSTAIEPTLVYGTHKRMLELHLAERHRAGALDARTIRLPAIVAKPPLPGPRPPAAFWGDLFHHAATGRRLTLPVRPDATVGMMSLGATVRNLLHAAVTAAPWPEGRACTLPALRVTPAGLIAALTGRLGPQVADLFTFAPDPWVMAQYGSYPEFASTAAGTLGFVPDASLNALVDAVLDQITQSLFLNGAQP
ncbi:MAG: NAD-dependent epimerase/dehydratase family protein [Rhodobacteraceae bacterium]|nr:NAD-dependent epimerase/dehydratase family protein [Paracoccaceae bacterium]